MNLQELSALAESSLKLQEGPLREFKAHHAGLFLREGLNAHGEFYKFTNLNRFLEEFKAESETPKAISPTDPDAFVIMDGKLIHSPEIKGLVARCLTSEDLSQLLSKDAPLTHLHHSLMGPGLLLEVEKNAEIKNAVKVIHGASSEGISAPVLVIRMSPFSKMTLLEETGTSRSSYVQIAETYAFLEASSSLEHIQLDRGTSSSLEHGSTWANVAGDASYKNWIFHLNGKLQRRNLDIKLKEPGSNGESYSLFLTNSDEHSDISTVINHMAPDSTSNQIAKGILGGVSKGIFTGKIHIHPKAQRVASGQINRNLLLSQKAQVHSQPQLEIFADDVKCSHGSTTGQMSPDELFYFKARGIPEDRARTLLAFGFALEVVLKIKHPQLRSAVEDAVMRTLKEKFLPEGKL